MSRSCTNDFSSKIMYIKIKDYIKVKFRFKEKRIRKTVGFDNIIPDIISELKLENSFTIEQIQSKWSDIVGDIISTHSIPERIFHKTLIIAVDHPVFANELTMIMDTCISRINEIFSFDMVDNIRVEIKRLYWKK